MKGFVRGMSSCYPAVVERGQVVDDEAPAELIVQVEERVLRSLALGQEVVVLTGDELDAVRAALASSRHYAAGQIRRASRALGCLS